MLSTTEKVLANRGVKNIDVFPKLNITDYKISHPTLFGEPLIAGYNIFNHHCGRQSSLGLIVDSDCDGYTAAALFYNYILKAFPQWIDKIKIYMHNGKEHGLNDIYKKMIEDKIELCICPDGGSNDFDAHKKLLDAGIDIIILDHHEVDDKPPLLYTEHFALINNQLSDYPNKYLSGVGVVYQFCKYIDFCYKTFFADEFLDLVALGNCADMMNMTEPETVYLIWKGFSCDNIIKNPFIQGMYEKNSFSLNKAEYKSYRGTISPIGAAFFIVPFINATVRSGTTEEKRLVFESMLENKANNIIPSTKRGHKAGETEKLITQVLRLVTNIKNRQTKAQDALVETLEQKIKDDDMLKDNALIFYLPSGAAAPTVVGLVANKIMNEYDRPVCIMLDTENGNYAGSARGCSLKGLLNFRDKCRQCNSVLYAQGHAQAFGISVAKVEAAAFKEQIQALVPSVDDEKTYNVDFIFSNTNQKDIYSIVNDIAMMNDFWGTGLERSRIALDHFKFTRADATVYRKSNNTLKLAACGVDVMLFDAPEELCHTLETTEGYVDLTCICECILNVWGGYTIPQLKVIDYKINGQCKYIF